MGDSAGAFSAVLNNQATPLGARYAVRSLLALLVQNFLVQKHFRRSLTIKQRLWGPGTQFTCSTGTKVQILTQLWGGPDDASTKLCARLYQVNPKFTCFTGTKSEMYLLYWYKSTNSDDKAPLLALLVQKYKF
jgi:hypothetical protein